MNPELLEILACPDCGGALSQQGETLRCTAGEHVFPIVRHIPRFVPADNYASSFGFQWNKFRGTQLDSRTGLPISRDRFLAQSRWAPEELAGRRVLDVGCGAGRFAEIALSAGGHVVAIDYSDAVDACYANLGAHRRLSVLQADVYRLPFKPGSFDYIYCFGVLQHTPDPHRAVIALAPPLKSGGKLAIDFYPRLALNTLWPKYWLRPITRRMHPERLFAIVHWLVPKLLPVARALAAVPLLGRRLRYLVPIMMYYGVSPLTREQHREWAILDTFDMLAPQHDHPQTASAVREWLMEAGLGQVESAREGLVVGRATKIG